MTSDKSRAPIVLLSAGWLIVAGLLSGCKESPANVFGPVKPGKVTTFLPPNTAFAKSLGITQGPVTADQARLIAAAAAGGIALQWETEDEDGTRVFGVLVQTAATAKDVKVRITDGAVTKIEDGGPDGGTSAGDGSD